MLEGLVINIDSKAYQVSTEGRFRHLPRICLLSVSS